jgi:predicted ATPase/DNA-binding SARP family transcriptional activator
VTGIGILGVVSIISDDGRPVALRAIRRRALLALLTARHGRSVDTDLLIDFLWPSRLPDHPEAALQSQIHHLRRQLGPLGSTLVTEEDGYRLACPPDDIDAVHFERLLAADTLADIDAALSLWRGPAYGDLAAVDLLRAAAERLEGLRADALERRAELLLGTGRDAEAEDAAATVALQHPYREGPVALRMRALARLGRHVDGLRVFADFRHRMVEDLGVEPSPSLRAVERQLLIHDRTPAIGVPGDSFVGRADELAAAVERLGRARLVTLTGPGGVGKSRLALHTAAAIADRFAGGVALCELAPVGRASAVVGAVASVLGLDDRAGRDLSTRIVEYLRGPTTLLVLDNCEHVLDAAAELVELILSRTPDTVVLATSRRRLGVPGEHAVAVEPLAVAEDGAAVELFGDRASAVRPGAELSGDDRTAAAEIGRLLGGLPLAIELAAARTLTRTPAELLAELRAGEPVGERHRDDRHRSVDATIDWSYELLSADEQAAYRSVAVFAGGWTLDAAAAVAAGGRRHVDALVEHSLVVARTVDGRTRFAMLEPVRQHAAAQLVAAGEDAAVKARHAQWAATFMETADAGLRSADEARWAKAVTLELGNLRAAHRWALEHDPSQARRIVAALYWHGYFRGPAEVFEWADDTIEHLDEGDPTAVGALATAALGAWRRGDLASARQLGERALALDTGAQPAPGARFAREALRSAAGLAGDQRTALEHRDAAQSLARQAGDTVHEAHTHALGALALGYLGRLEEAAAELAAAQRLLDAAGNPTTQAMCAYVNGEMLVEASPAEALEHLLESRRLAREVGNDFVVGIAGVSAVSCAARLGDPAGALGEFRDVIATFRRGGAWPQLWTTLRALVRTLASAGRDTDAAILLGAVRATGSGAPIHGGDAEHLREVATTLRARLGAARYEALLAEGAALGDEAAVARAIAAVDAVT